MGLFGIDFYNAKRIIKKRLLTLNNVLDVGVFLMNSDYYPFIASLSVKKLYLMIAMKKNVEHINKIICIALLIQ